MDQAGHLDSALGAFDPHPGLPIGPVKARVGAVQPKVQSEIVKVLFAFGWALETLLSGTGVLGP